MYTHGHTVATPFTLLRAVEILAKENLTSLLLPKSPKHNGSGKTTSANTAWYHSVRCMLYGTLPPAPPCGPSVSASPIKMKTPPSSCPPA